MESLTRSIERMNGNMTVSQEYLLGKLKPLFEYSLDLAMKRQTPSKRKPVWARIAVQAAGVMGGILKDVELEALRDEVEALKL